MLTATFTTDGQRINISYRVKWQIVGPKKTAESIGAMEPLKSIIYCETIKSFHALGASFTSNQFIKNEPNIDISTINQSLEQYGIKVNTINIKDIETDQAQTTLFSNPSQPLQTQSAQYNSLPSTPAPGQQH